MEMNRDSREGATAIIPEREIPAPTFHCLSVWKAHRACPNYSSQDRGEFIPMVDQEQ